MKQLIQKLKDGQVKVVEVPTPLLAPGQVLVRNHYSLISGGTEGSTVKAARKNLIGKARERPQQVKQVLDVMKVQGVRQAYRAVTKKLDALSPLGYSCSGQIIEVGESVRGFKVGDYVACGGNNANHAEVVSVPANLCARLSIDRTLHTSEKLRLAAYNTLGAIAMQGVRQADLRLGENCAVIGLGLLGQITCQLLRASGVRVVGTDIAKIAVNAANEHSADLALLQSDLGAARRIEQFSKGLGVDAVIITAATDSLQPINFAGEISRKRGRVVIVGNVPSGFDREPYYYRKELEIRMSCSYGPGRYDSSYEVKGQDYPHAYVRWTEKRNMEAFHALLSSDAINIDYLTTHEFTLDETPNAYDMVVNHTEPYLGVLIRYPLDSPINTSPIRVHPTAKSGPVNLAFVGAGNYAQGHLLPNVPKTPFVSRKAILTSSGASSKGVAKRFGFEFCTSEMSGIYECADINTVFVSTRHDSHADYIREGVKSGKHSFVEKPLCLSFPQLEEIESTYTLLGSKAPLLMVGYNRRFAPLATALKQRMPSGRMAMLYRINAGTIPTDHWIQDLEIGGGRIVGEVCHFIDFMTYICGSLPIYVYASAMADPQGTNDTVVINLEFASGSVGSIAYFADGAKSLFKEYFEVSCAGVTGVIRDFRELEIYGAGKKHRTKKLGQDKGQKVMVQRFIEAVSDGNNSPISPAELFAVSRASLGAVESLNSRMPYSLSICEPPD